MWRTVVALGAGLLGLVPIANIVRIVATTGANVPSSDDEYFVNHLVGPILDGNYWWPRFFRDAFTNTHADYFPGLLYVAVAALADLNVYIILYLGLALAALRLLLLYLLLARGRGFAARAMLWPLVAALTFSTAQISIFEHPFSSSTINLSLLGLTIGLCGLGWFPERRRGLALMLGGGVLAAWSFGSGLIAWPVLLLGLRLRGVRRAGAYLALLGGLLLTALPYAAFLLLAPENAETTAPTLWRILLAPVVLLGFPFAQAFSRPIAGAVGLLGLGGAGVALVLLRRRGGSWQESATVTASLLLAFGTLAAIQIGLFRGRTAQWYTYVGVLFWLGLAGLVFADYPRGSRFFRDRRRWRGAALGGLALLYLTSNLTYADKSIFLVTRSPAAASCVRAYRTAPAVCDQLLRPYPGDFTRDYLAGLAATLERHRLAVFAPRQEWALQGDFGLGNVRVVPDDAARWSPDRSTAATPWTDPRHLDLALHDAGKVGWIVAIPRDARSAVLHTAMAVASAPDGATFAFSVERPDGTMRTLATRHLAADAQGWQELEVPLGTFAGERIVLWLSNDSCGGASCLGFYRYPTIAVDLGR